MPLPELIEIVPLDKPVRAKITVPGSKSITNRALILAALAQGETTLRGALWSEDTQVMTECLQKLGFAVEVTLDPDEFCNRTITVKGLGGTIPNAGTEQKPLELFVGNAGTAARFLSALVCLGKGVYRLSGVPRMHERPQAALFTALRELGYRVESEKGNDKLPVIIYGTGPKAGSCTVSVEESSQFASALYLAAKTGNWTIETVDADAAAELPYVEMTQRLISAFPSSGGIFSIEADSSSGSYFQAAGWLAKKTFGNATLHISVANWPESLLQIDSEFASYLYSLESLTEKELQISRRDELGDSIMTAMILAPFTNRPVKFVHLERLRVQESDRVLAFYNELRKCGANIKMTDKGDTLRILPSELQSAEIETYNDHRIAMCFAILGLKVPGIKLRNPACVKKTFPNFFQKLAAAPAAGLGAIIRDAKTGRELRGEELFAE